MPALQLGTTTRAVTAALLGALTLSACSGASGTEGPDRATGATGSEATEVAVELRDNLARPRNVAVDKRVEYTVDHGRFEKVRARVAGGEPLAGEVVRDGRVWRSTDRLEPGTTYAVRTTIRAADGQTERRTRRFSTVDLTLDPQTYASIAPLDGETVGVGMPVIVSFDIPVTDRVSIERHMSVTATPEQPGTWHWVTDSEVHYRPRTYWQPGSEVTVDVDINSVPAGNGVFGQESRLISFDVGDSVVHEVDVDAHVMRSYVNGDLARTSPISAGKDGFETRSGTKVIIAKHRYKTMDAATTGIPPGHPEYYNIEDVEYALRVTYSGEFLHAAPWSVGSQGSANVSHGCVGMSLEDAAWVYNVSRRGDVVEVTGTDRQMTLYNGWGDWNASFAEYAEASAL